ncbi:MAG: 50S ribosomal protein P1 [Candidatus Diapherotrites archaeon]|uniref:Large ribosomal subunit protein P1 n=1 Tax=Candidatus Iainarchaeum sp. TaxID=3101447 RepID=A0A2D6M126_9ARCH|nr:50S ribosomal protein P1 [Candidatus Diapherotrites archaeon]
MEYVYSAMLLHSAGHEVKEDAVTKVLEAAGVKADSARVKALVASLKDVNIDEAIEKAAAVPAAAPAAASAAEATGEAKEEKKEEEPGKTEEEAAEGLSSLFG